MEAPAFRRLLTGLDTVQVAYYLSRELGGPKPATANSSRRYRGLAKNLHRLEVTAALANLFLVRQRLRHA